MITFKKTLSLVSFIWKAFCSTLNSRIGELEDWRIRFLMSRTDNFKGKFDFNDLSVGFHKNSIKNLWEFTQHTTFDAATRFLSFVKYNQIACCSLTKKEELEIYQIFHSCNFTKKLREVEIYQIFHSCNLTKKLRGQMRNRAHYFWRSIVTFQTLISREKLT